MYIGLEGRLSDVGPPACDPSSVCPYTITPPMLGPHDPSDADPDALEESDQPEHRRFKLQRDVRKRLDHYLRDRLRSLSRSRLQKLINEGAVTVNGREPKSSTILRLGDVIDVLVPPAPIKQLPAENMPLDVIHEDDHIIVINKQANLVVHPARSNVTGTLLNALAWYYRHRPDDGLDALSTVGKEEFRPGIVHRLDKDTTGCIVLAKTDTAHYRLGRQWEARNVQKYYLAIVHGQVPPPGQVIDAPVGKHSKVMQAYAVRHDSNGRDAITLCRVREVFDGYTLVELELKTGRTHQIRVHLNWLGFPIISDIMYGGEPVGSPEIDHPPKAAGAQLMLSYARQKEDGLKVWEQMGQRTDLLIGRPALHAAVLQFRHPATDQPVTFTAPLPADMATVLGQLRTHRRQSGPLNPPDAVVQIDS